MAKNPSTISKRILNKISWEYRNIVRNRFNTIYHCCIQKSGSQWFKQVFKDSLIWKNTKLHIYSPYDNFITEDANILKNLEKLPKGLIISPLYIRYDRFDAMEKPKNSKSFFIARDPRDLIISNYFSLKHSHSPYVQYILEMRKKLNDMSQFDGILEIINSFTIGTKETLNGWFTQNSPNIKLIKFEDIFGNKQKQIFTELINHCGIKIPEEHINSLLDKYSFKKISGRKLGKEDINHHYRKGTPGDWKNYFTEEHKDLFKELSGDLLITCGYEKNNNW